MIAQTKMKLIKELVMVAIGIGIALSPAPDGLEAKAMHFLGIFIWAILNWALPVLPSFVVGLLLMIGIVAFKIAPFKTAFSPMAGTTVWLIIGVLALGGAVSKTGLLSRLSFGIMNIFPASFKGQVAALIGAGVLIGPFMPSTTAKVSIVGGFSTRIAELLGFEPYSRGMNGIFLAMYTGFSLLAVTFISSSFYSYFILGMIPKEDADYFTFFTWTLAMLPWGVFMIVASYFAIMFMYKPENERKLEKTEIKRMTAELGPMSRDEKVTLFILIICLVCWALERVIGIAAVIPSILGMCALFIFKVLEPKEFNTRINWSILVLAASVIALAPVVKAVGLNEWMAANIGRLMENVGSNPYVFVTAVALLVLLSRFILVSGATAISIMVVLLVPFCQAANMSAWVGGAIAYVMAQPFFFKYQNPNFIIGYAAAGGEEKISFKHCIPYSLVYHALAIVGLLLSVPWWQYLGIIR